MLRAAFVFLGAFFIVSLASAQVPLSQDTFISPAKRTTNYGTNSSLAVQAGGGITSFNMTCPLCPPVSPRVN